MCISIVFGISLAGGESGEVRKNMVNLGRKYAYGIGWGRESLLPGAEDRIMEVLGYPAAVFEVHDLPEIHCACDIDHDIRIGSKLGRRSRFFDFVREVLAYRYVTSLSVLFFQEQWPDHNNVRRHRGDYEGFVDLLNRWHTWQVEGFEPNRGAYFIAEETPLLYAFSV